MNVDQIKKLEKKYFSEIINIIKLNEFEKDLINIEKYIQDNYEYLRKNTSQENKINVAVERIIRYYIYNNLKINNIYPSPLSADLAVELDDVILSIDAKTINMITNGGDDKSIHFQKDQITFNNNPLYKQKVKGYDFSGALFPPKLESFYNNKPVLTYFITINYVDVPNMKKFHLQHMSLCCVPHQDIVKKDFNNNIISNLKTWGYINKKEADNLGKKYAPLKIAKSKAFSHWIPFSIKGENKIDAWLDPQLDHPYDGIDGKCVRKHIDGAFKIVAYGLSARIDKNIITDRKDSNGESWKGYYKIDIIPKGANTK